MLSSRSLLALALAHALVVGCRRDDPAAPSDAAPPVPVASAAVSTPDAAALEARPTWVDRLASEADFLRYSKEIGGERFTKFVLNLHTGAMYYVDAEIYRMHKDFIFAELLKTERTKEAEREFDKNYGKDKPDYVMCYLVHHLEPDLWSLAFWDGDKATAEHVRLAWKRMKETFYLADKVKFRPNSLYQEEVAAKLKELPILTNDQLYKESGYQPFHRGTAVGRLHVVAAGSDYTSLSLEPDEIVLLPESLPDITPVAGIVSQGFSTPLSHVNLRAGAWGIPNIGVKDALSRFAKLDGKTVFLQANESTFVLREATVAEATAARSAKKQAQTVQVPKANLGVTTLTSLDAIRAADASAFGSKTANLGEIVHGKLAGFAVPPGFGVPIAWYEAHLRRAGLFTRIESTLGDPTFRSNMTVRRDALASLRESITSAPLDPAFVAALGKALDTLTRPGDAGTGDVGVFVRSSTNAEDLPGFSGAGLYDTVPNARGLDAVATAVKRVWASVWNLAAYDERERYGIDHRQVFGAVLVQIGIDATAAGVLVTAHPTDPSEQNTFTINAKSGLGIRVVEGKKGPEIILYNVFNKGLRVVSRSDDDLRSVFASDGGVQLVPNDARGKPVLTSARVALLGAAAQRIRGLFSRERPLDIEWLLRGEELFIVQARPYLVKNAPPSTAPLDAPP